MRWVLFFVCAFFFSLGDYLCSMESLRHGRFWFTAFGALVGGCGYVVFSELSKTTPLAAMGGYINGAVVIITCLFFGYLLQGNRLSNSEWFWIAVIFIGICGLGYSQSGLENS